MFPAESGRKPLGYTSPVWLIKAKPFPSLTPEGAWAISSSIAWGPAGGRGKAERNLCSAKPFLHPERERQATEVGRYGSGVWLEHRSIAWSQVPCAKQWLTVGATN